MTLLAPEGIRLTHEQRERVVGILLSTVSAVEAAVPYVDDDDASDSIPLAPSYVWCKTPLSEVGWSFEWSLPAYDLLVLDEEKRAPKAAIAALEVLRVEPLFREGEFAFLSTWEVESNGFSSYGHDEYEYRHIEPSIACGPPPEWFSGNSDDDSVVGKCDFFEVCVTSDSITFFSQEFCETRVVEFALALTGFRLSRPDTEFVQNVALRCEPIPPASMSTKESFARLITTLVSNGLVVLRPNATSDDVCALLEPERPNLLKVLDESPDVEDWFLSDDELRAVLDLW